MINLHEYINPDGKELTKQARKGNHVHLWEQLPKSDDIIQRKGKLGINSTRNSFFITTSVSCNEVNPERVTKMLAPRVISSRRRRRK